MTGCNEGLRGSGHDRHQQLIGTTLLFSATELLRSGTEKTDGMVFSEIRESLDPIHKDHGGGFKDAGKDAAERNNIGEMTNWLRKLKPRHIWEGRDAAWG